MRSFPLEIALFGIAATTPAAAFAQDAQIAAPSFGELEAHYPHDIRLAKAQIAAQMDLARATLRESVRPGTALAVAETRLQAAGAVCRAVRHPAGLVKCLYHEYDLGDGAADDIRWTVALHVASDQVVDLSVDRYVDRHGSN